MVFQASEQRDSGARREVQLYVNLVGIISCSNASRDFMVSDNNLQPIKIGFAVTMSSHG
jgi:hypothetical protein